MGAGILAPFRLEGYRRVPARLRQAPALGVLTLCGLTLAEVELPDGKRQGHQTEPDPTDDTTSGEGLVIVHEEQAEADEHGQPAETEEQPGEAEAAVPTLLPMLAREAVQQVGLHLVIELAPANGLIQEPQPLPLLGLEPDLDAVGLSRILSVLRI